MAVTPPAKPAHTRRVWIVLLAVAALWGALAFGLEAFLNRVTPAALPAVSADTRAFHDAQLVADLHADSLLFRRDLSQRARFGHADFSRLRSGGVGLQVFAVVTRVPLGSNFDHTPADRLDLVRAYGCVTWAPSCFAGPFRRLADQAERLANSVARDSKAVWIRSREDLARFEIRHREDPETLGVLLAIEGAHALEGEVANLERAHALGVRMIGLTHFFDNAYAGSAHGVDKNGLTELGRDTLIRMQQLGMVVDLAHLAPRAIPQVLAHAKNPVVVSHGGAYGVCPSRRTLSDDEIRAVAANGGVIGIGFWPGAICGTTPADVARSVRYVVERVGDDHVAFGSDYDGATHVGFDATAFPSLTQALRDSGLSDASVRKVLGGNVLRVLRENLP
ncbi:MAG: dipeptidase [Myxococcota bacterium]